MQLVKEMGIDKRKMLFIGDTRHDAEVAAQIGIDCILIAHGHHSQERLKPMGVPLLSSLNDLILLL